MDFRITKPFWQVLGLGVLAGMRATSAPAIASHILSHRSKKMTNSLRFMQSETLAHTLKFVAMGELVADKLPSAPDRTKPLGLAVRCLSGALAGASMYKSNNKNLIAGALLGGTAAFASTFGSFFLRKFIVEGGHFKDPAVGAIEDTLVIGTGFGIIIMS